MAWGILSTAGQPLAAFHEALFVHCYSVGLAVGGGLACGGVGGTGGVDAEGGGWGAALVGGGCAEGAGQWLAAEERDAVLSVWR